ncbi:MAG TPA: VWA domain-containing protein [Planctomycetota bacterium]|nr:VWA domain-containing protein [Planctomycetota bacterium]
MEFLSAPLLWGMAAAGIPVIIHLLGRTRPVPHRFPAMRFILRSQKSSSRALKLKHFLVLLLRILAVVGIAFALARPMTGSSELSAGWIAGGILIAALSGIALYHREFITALMGLLVLAGLWHSYPAETPLAQQALRGDYVLVMDQSMSMGYLEPDGTRFDLARRQAQQFLDRLAPDARVALILATENAERVQSRLSYRHEIVRQKLAEAQPTGRGLDLAQALQAAQEIIKRDRSDAGAAILFFTDLQAAAISRVLMKAPAATGDTAAKLIVVDVASGNAKNGAALSGRLSASTLPAESKATITAKVRPLDSEHACLVELYVDGKKLAQKLVEPKGQPVVDVELEFPTGVAGSHSGRVHLPDSDRLPLDQDFHFAYSAGRPPTALILERPGQADGKGSGFFLRAALQPSSGEETLGISGLACVVEPAGALTQAKLSKYRVVILADCGPLTESSWSALQQWTSEGGGLFVWLGPRTDGSFSRYGFSQHAAYNGLLPGQIGTPFVLQPPQTIAVTQPEHPVLAHATPGVSSILRETPVRQIVKVTPDARDTTAAVILSTSDSSPLLLEKLYGRGRVLLATVDPTLETSDLPKRGEAFVTLLLDSVRLLSGEENGIRARLGFPFILSIPSAPEDGQVLWRKPGVDKPEILRVDTSVNLKTAATQTGPVTVVVPAIDTPGIHSFSWSPPGAARPLSKLLAVNAEAGESELTKASPELALKAMSPLKAQIVKTIGESTVVAGNNGGEQRRELSVALLLILFALLLAESFFSNRLYKNEVESSTPETTVQVESNLEPAIQHAPAEKTDAAS